jgi:hypothetical protein
MLEDLSDFVGEEGICEYTDTSKIRNYFDSFFKEGNMIVSTDIEKSYGGAEECYGPLFS